MNDKYYYSDVFNHITKYKKKILRLESSWDKELNEEINKGLFERLVFSNHIDWEEFNFIPSIKENVSEFAIVNYDKSINGIQYFDTLEIGTFESVKDEPLDFSALKKLRQASIYWNKKYSTNIFNLPKLEDLTIKYWKHEGINTGHKNKSLNKLELTETQLKTLDGIENFANLEELNIHYAPKLSDISALKKCKKIKKIHIQSAKKIENLEILGQLKNLEYVYFEKLGTQENLKFLANCKKLYHLNFLGTTLTDGDMTFLNEIKKLEMVNYDNKKHYSVKAKDYRKKLGLSF